MIRQLKIYGIKYQKARFFVNRMDLFDLRDMPFSIVVLRSVLLYTAARHICLLFDIVGIIPIPI